MRTAESILHERHGCDLRPCSEKAAQSDGAAVAVRRTRHLEYPTDSNWFADDGRG